MPSPEDNAPDAENPQEMLVEAALAEYMRKSDTGELTDRDAFLLQHPELREQLLDLLSAADWIESLAGPTAAESGIVAKRASGSHDPQATSGTRHAVDAGRASANESTSDGLPTFQSHAEVDASKGVSDWSANHEETLPHNSMLPEEAPTDSTLPIQSATNAAGKSQDEGPAGEPSDTPKKERRLQSLFGSTDAHFQQPQAGQSDADVSGSPPAGRSQTLRSNSSTKQPALPCRFGDYILERVLGRGGMGVVYFGHQVRLDRPVAVKMIRSGALASEEEVLRFYAEARSAARLDHPNIVTVYQCGEYDGHRFFSMDFVDGTDLAQRCAESPIECRLAARYVRDAALAIQYAHDRGILHRDLKPANVLVDQNDAVRITDFGLAKSIETESGLTATGAALGTPSYMSPEQAAGNVDEQGVATDVYSLGAILFTIVTGRPPFKAASVVQTIMQVIHRPAPMANSINPKVDEDIATIIDRCLQKSPDRRYPSAAALAADLTRYLEFKPIEARPLSNIRRAWYWLLGVPIFGAVLDTRVMEPTDAHRWVQRGLISIGMMIVLAWFLMLIPSSVWYKNRIPQTVRISSGMTGGSYHALAETIRSTLSAGADCEVVTLESEGSQENVERLVGRQADLGLVQEDATDSESISILAPLYYELVHVLVRDELAIQSLSELKNCRLWIGGKKSGSNRLAGLILRHAGLSLDEVAVSDAADMPTVVDSQPIDAAIMVSKSGSPQIASLLASGFHLIAIPDAWQFALDEPIFHADLIGPEDYPQSNLPPDGVATVATTAFLAAREDAPSVLVHAVLKHLFTPEVVAANGILSANEAAHWPKNSWHPAAKEFFAAYRGSFPARTDVHSGSDVRSKVSDASSRN